MAVAALHLASVTALGSCPQQQQQQQQQHQQLQQQRKRPVLRQQPNAVGTRNGIARFRTSFARRLNRLGLAASVSSVPRAAFAAPCSRSARHPQNRQPRLCVQASTAGAAGDASFPSYPQGPGGSSSSASSGSSSDTSSSSGKCKAPAPALISDKIWPALGACVAFAGLAAADHWLQPHGMSATMASFAAVCALLFCSPQAPAAQRGRILTAHIAAAVIGVACAAVFGATAAARCVAVGAIIGFMSVANCMHPPAAGIPVIFIDAPKFQRLGWWYALFPGIIGCLWLFAVQEVVLFLQDRVRF